MLELRSLTKSFGALRAVDDVSLAVSAGEIVALLGPSGCGKSTLLMLVAGLETLDAGEVLWQGAALTGVPTHQRGFGLMFQDYALFPHKNVAQNVGFGLKMQGASRKEIDERVRWALQLAGLAGFEQRDVNTLSGGEQQRVALARALAPRPRLLMLDEPLGALDRALRERLLDDLRAILRSLRQTTLYVTHDQEEAFALADRVAVMRAGKIVQIGPPADVYARPASRFVAGFLGLTNILTGQLRQTNGETVVITEVGEFVTKEKGEIKEKEFVEVLLRPEGATVISNEATEATAIRDTQYAIRSNSIEGKILEKSFHGSRTTLKVLAGGRTLTFEFPATPPLPAAGETVRLRVAPDAIHFIA